MSVYECLVFRIAAVLLDHGCEARTMSDLARHCGMTRRALYHHFRNKDEAFRETIRPGNERTRRASLAEGEKQIAQGVGLLDVVTGILDVRYGETRRKLAASPFAQEFNDYAFRICRPAMLEAARLFQVDFVALLAGMLSANAIDLKADMTVERLVQLLCDGARGTNQSFLAPTPDSIRDRYRVMSKVILFGTVVGP